jgi:hypothetical protein
MKRKHFDCDKQLFNHDARRRKRHQIECDLFRNHSASQPLSDDRSLLPALTEAALLASQRTRSTTQSVASWLATEVPECRPLETPPPDDVSKSHPTLHKRQPHTMFPSAGEATPSDSLKRRKACDTDDEYGDNMQPEQRASQLSNTLALNTRTTLRPHSRVSSSVPRSSSQSSPTQRSRSSSPRKPTATREDQLSSFVPSVYFASLDQAQGYSVHIPDSLLSLLGQFEVST